MRISLFGTVGVVADSGGEPVVELPHRPGIVLALLASRYQRTVRDDTLIEAIWPSVPPASARQALQGYVVAVRNALQPDRPAGDPGTFVVRDSAGYRLDVGSDELDLAQFDALSDAALGGSDDQALDRMIRLSDQLIAADLTEAEWADAVRASVAERRRAALSERFELELEMDTGSAVLGRMRAAVAEYPYDEALVGSLMTALYRSGRQAEALSVFDSLRRRLRDELGVSPGERLAALHLAVLDHAQSLDLEPVGSDSADVTRESGADGGLVGRSDDVAAVVEALITRRTVTVVGPGGAGKTTLAGAAMNELAEKFPEPAVVDASTVGDGTLLDEIARLVGADRHPMFTTDEALATAFDDRPHLVVIDTCEARLVEVREVADRLRERRSVFLLLVSREPVRHAGENVHRMAGLGTIHAAALLRSLIGTGADTDEQAMSELARRVDCLPLALEMIAPRVASLGASTVLREVDALTPVVSSSPTGDSPARHRSLDALVQWSLDRVDRDARDLLVRCAALDGAFPIGALSDLPPSRGAGSAPITSSLAVLVDSSLISREGDAPPIFTIYDTVRDAVRRRFPDEVAVEQAAIDAHVTQAAWADYTGASDEPVARWVAQRFGTTLDRLLTEPNYQAVMLATAAARRWLDVGSLAQGSAALERALAAAPGVAPPLASIGWTILGFNQVYQGELQAALTSYRRAAALADSVPMEGYVELVTSAVAWLECDFERSWEIAASAVQKVSTSSRRAPANLVAFAKSALFAGDLDGAADCYDRALQLSRDGGDAVAEANAVRLAAIVQAMRGQHDRALGEALRAAALHDAASSTLGAAQAASTVALVAALAGDSATAGIWATRAINHARRQFDIQTVCVVIPVIASIDIAENRTDRAVQLVGWLDRYVDGQQHVRHPTTTALFDDIEVVLEGLDPDVRRRWQAQGASMSAAQMIDLAAQ